MTIDLGYAHYTDRKSTRLNSSHQIISYAVCCLKKKKRHCAIHPAPLLSHMAKSHEQLDPIFQALSDPTRRVVLGRLGRVLFFLNDRATPEITPLPPPITLPI